MSEAIPAPNQDRVIDSLNARVIELENALDLERVHNDHLHTVNIDCKNQIRALKMKLKVVVLPSTVQRLVKEIEAGDKRFELLQNAFVDAIGLIPVTEDNKTKLDYLKSVFREVS